MLKAPPPLPPSPPPAPSRLPVILSALVLPGTGQLLQRRWLAAAFYGIGCLAGFAVFCVAAFQIVFSFYDLGFNTNSYQQTPLPVRRGIVSFLVTLLLYIAGLIDTHRAYRRACAQWALRNLESRIRNSGGASQP